MDSSIHKSILMPCDAMCIDYWFSCCLEDWDEVEKDMEKNGKGKSLSKVILWNRTLEKITERETKIQKNI